MVFCLLPLSRIALGTRLIYSVYFDENRRRTTVCAPRGGSHLFNEKRPEQLEANPEWTKANSHAILPFLLLQTPYERTAAIFNQLFRIPRQY